MWFNFFDFQGNGWNIEDIFWYLTFIVTIGVPALVFLYRKSVKAWWKKRKCRKWQEQNDLILETIRPLMDEAMVELRKEIAVATKPIQPDSNGGFSLPDLHTKVDVLVERQGDILDLVENMNDDIRSERSRLDTHLNYHINKS